MFEPRETRGALRAGGWRVVAALVIGLGFGAARVDAAAGDLDPGFGTGGLVVSALSPDADTANAIAVQPDGKIVVGGSGFGTSDLMLARYTANGALDPTFGTGGVVRGGISGEAVIDLSIQSNGRIVAAVQWAYGILVAGYTSDGAVDHSFGVFGSGRTFLDSLDAGTAGQGGIVQQIGVPYYDGAIVIGGSLGGSGTFALERVFRDGYPDSAFGVFFGICALSAGLDGELWDVAVLPGGKFVAVGAASSAGDMDFAIARFDEFGCPDPTFGTNGLVLTPILPGATGERARSVAVQPDGRIVVLGDTGGSPSAFAVVRYEPDGSLDPTFGNAGVTLVSVGTTDVARDLVSSASGGFVVGGDADGLFTLVRLDAAGVVDPTFGTDGVVRVEQAPLPPCCAELRAVALQPNGRIVAAGHAVVEGSTSGLDVVLAGLFGGNCGDGVVDAGEQCDDGNRGAGDCCSPRCERDAAGAPCDDDGLRCTHDRCDASGACTHPGDLRSGCGTSIMTGGARLVVEHDARAGRDALAWTLRRGPGIAPAELGDPLAATGYTLCGFADDATVAFELDAPAGRTCAGAACWTSFRSGYRYRNRTGDPTGTTRLLATAGAAGEPRAVVRGKGSHLSLPPLPTTLPLRVQLHADSGLCLESRFATAVRNDARRLRATSDD